MATNDGGPAMLGHDDRPIFADPLTERVYAGLTTEARSRIRKMLRTAWQDTIELVPDDFVDACGLDHGLFAVSDCVARASVTFSSAGQGEVSASRDYVMIGGDLPDTVLASLKGRTMTDVVDHPLLGELVVTGVDTTQRGHRLFHAYVPRYLVDVN